MGDRGRILTIAPIVQPDPLASVAIHPVSQSDTAKLSQSLNRLVAEDPTLHWYTEPSTHETILAGMGVAHLDIAVHKAMSKFGVHLRTTTPKVPYRETITKTAEADYTHKKQTGGAGQYARVVLRVEPVEESRGFEFGSEIFGGAVSAPFVSATEKGCRQALEGGVLAGYPVVGVRVVITDGKMHPVDSKEIAFQTAGREGFKDKQALDRLAQRFGASGKSTVGTVRLPWLTRVTMSAASGCSSMSTSANGMFSRSSWNFSRRQ